MQGNVLVFSIALEGFDHLFGDCIQTHIKYCRHFNYQYVLVNRAPRRLCREEAAWLKVPLIRAALAANYEWVAFLDADCEIRSHAPGFSEYLSARSESKTVFMAPGFSGRINSGVIFARKAPASLGFFDTLVSNADVAIPAEDSVGWGENGHFIYFGKESPAVYLLEHDLWNNNSRLDDHSYIQHYVRGPLREWYMANRVEPRENNNAFRVFITHLSRLMLQRFQRESSQPEKPLVISESIHQLLPYYKKKYPAFRSS